MKLLYTSSFCVLLLFLFLPVGAVKVVIASALLLVYPGLIISQYIFDDESHALIVSPVVGASFWITVFYALSHFGLVRAEPVIVLSAVSAVLLDKKGVRCPLHKWMVVLFGCMVFSTLYFYQWNTSLIPPLDDAKFHSLFVVAIENHHALPSDYGMYAEIPRLTYPLGYHALLAVIKELSGEPLFPVVTLSTWFLLLQTPACFYLFSLPYGKKVALFSAISFSFFSIFYHRLEQTSTYPILLAIEILVLSLCVLQKVLENFSFKRALLLSLLITGAVEANTYMILVYVPFFVFYGGYLLLRKRDFSSRLVLIVLVAGIVLIPYLVRFRLYEPHQEELPYLRAWYSRDSLDSVEKLSTTLSSMSPFLFLFSLVSIPELKKKDGAVPLFLLMSTLVIPFLSVVKVDYPGWYTVTPNRFLNYAFIPLCVFSGMGVARLTSVLGEKKMVSTLVVTALILHFTDTFYPWGRFPDVYEINPPEDIAVIYSMEALPPGAVILNFAAQYDPSGWIPSLVGKKIFLSPFLSQRGDGCMYYLKAPERVEDLLIYLRTIQSGSIHSREAFKFLEKYSLGYVFIPSQKQGVGGGVVDVEAFLNSPCYTLVNRKGDSHLFRAEIPPEPVNRIIVEGPLISLEADEFNSIIGITYEYTPGESFEIHCEGKSIYLDLGKYPHEDICIIYVGRYNLAPVMLIWGYGWQGTYAGSLLMGDPDVYREYSDANILLVRWVNSNHNDRVEMSEIKVESKTVWRYTKPAIPELMSHEDVIFLVNQVVRTRVGSTFFDDHFKMVKVDETPELPFIWVITYEYTYNGYTVDCLVAVDTGVIPLRSSRIIYELSSIPLEPQRICISEEEARDIARKYGFEPYTVVLFCNSEFHRIHWKIVGNGESGGGVLLIDAENGTILDM